MSPIFQKLIIMKKKYKLLLFLVVGLLVFPLSFKAQDLVNSKSVSLGSLRVNQIQVLGTHNSYAQPVDDQLLDYVSQVLESSKHKMFGAMSQEQLDFFNEYHPNSVSFKESLTYAHPSFEVQLNHGLRSLELDVYHDPLGGLYLNPQGYTYLQEKGITDLKAHNTNGLDEPGFKVLHIPDVDFRSQYPRFSDALKAIKKWSDNNKDHIPLFIMVEAKDASFPVFENHTKVVAYDKQAFDLLDQQISDIIGIENIITPDVVRGDYPTLNQAILNHNWPLLSQSRGKFIFMLLPSTGGVSSTDSPYVQGAANLENRIMFVQSKPTDTYGAFLLLDNAIVRQQDIQNYVKQGYLVRTRSDIDAYEAKVNDLTRAKSAFSSGAQVISTDYFSKEYNPFKNDYFVGFKNQELGFQVNPVNAHVE